MLVVMALAILLSLPAGANFAKMPVTINALALALTLGFYVALIILIRRTWLLVLITLPVLAINAIELFNIIVYGEMISLGALQAVLYVDPHEAREYIGEHASILLIVGLAITAYVGLIALRSWLDRLRLVRRLTIAAVTLAVPAGLLAANLALAGSKDDVYLPTRFLDHVAILLGANPLKHTLSGIAVVAGARADMARLGAEREQHRFQARRIGTVPDQETYVLVIGESSRRRSWSLYGYGRATSPRLAARPDLIAFRDAVSPSVTTSYSLPYLLTLVPVDQREQFYRTRSLVSAFRESGFRTFWLSNQGAHRAVVGNEIALMMGEADQVETTNSGFASTQYDEVLLPLFDRALADPAPRKLIIVHTMGSHSNYRQRVPSDWPQTDPAVPVRQAHGFADLNAGMIGVIEDYDRTIAYTDWFLDQLVTRLTAAGRYGGLVFFSDHGQRLFDDPAGEKGHGFATVKAPDIEIPLLVWLSPAFIAAYPERSAAIAANASKPVSTGALAASLLDLAAIGVDMPEARASFFRPDYRPGRRLVLTLRNDVIDADGAELMVSSSRAPGQ